MTVQINESQPGSHRNLQSSNSQENPRIVKPLINWARKATTSDGKSLIGVSIPLDLELLAFFENKQVDDKDIWGAIFL